MSAGDGIEVARKFFADYASELRQIEPRTATEMSYRMAMQGLLKAIAAALNRNAEILHEPKREPNRGAPDFMIRQAGRILGYVETKAIGTALSETAKSVQIKKYCQLSKNLLLTDYCDFMLIRDSEIIAHERLLDGHDFHLDASRADAVAKLIKKFLLARPAAIADSSKLAQALSIRARWLRDGFNQALELQQKEDRKGQLHGLYEAFKGQIFRHLKLQEFADAFAQALTYALFLARLDAPATALPITLINAKSFIADNFALIRELAGFLDMIEEDDYRNIKWAVEEILDIMNGLDVAELQRDLAFNNKLPRRDGLDSVETERELFARDPYIYFYEDFLKAYDKDMRKGRGVYYTPPPVVQFIVAAIDDVLKDIFAINKGLADHKQVTVLDFAAGTGTFMLEVIRRILDAVSSRAERHLIISEHVLKNIYAFEYLIAPYAIAHLKLSQFLKDAGHHLTAKEKLQIYLTNTLEPIEPQINLLLPALTHEAEAAQNVKDKTALLVITGNPPYSGHSKNTGTWITERLKEAYYTVDGAPLGERNPKWLQDDYVKFIRFAQWKMDQVEEGVVGIITNHSFLDNPTFRGMRQSLMKTFDRLYVLDLHGSIKKKETTPDGGKDENVFDIEQGVAISIMIKKAGLSRGVFHADCYGTRDSKYRFLLDNDFKAIGWHSVVPETPDYLFVPQDRAGLAAYQGGWKVTDIFSVSVLGFQTHRDAFAIAMSKDDIKRRVKDFIEPSLSDDELSKKYQIKESKGWNISNSRNLLRKNKDWEKAIIQCSYRPFDYRWCFFGYVFMDRPRSVFLNHCFLRENIILGIGRSGQAVSERPWELVTISRLIVDANHFRRGGVNCFPLYLYPPKEDEKQSKTRHDLYDDTDDPFQGNPRIENFTPQFRAFIDEKYGSGISPETILGYLYAVLHSPAYREKYRDFLRRDFPYIPFVDDRAVFMQLAALGDTLIAAHLMQTPSRDYTIAVEIQYMSKEPPPQGLQIDKPAYVEAEQRFYINPKRGIFFAPIPVECWDFHIGGYRVLEKYIKSRSGRSLSLDEIDTVRAIVNALAITLTTMQKIDAVLPL